MSKKDTFPAKIVKVVNDYTVVLNRGTRDGLKEGQRFLVYRVDSEPLIDPDSGEDLGLLELVVGRGEIIHVQEAMSTLKSTKREPNVRRHVKKHGLQAIMGPESETVTEVGDIAPFEYPEIGDFAKPI